LPISGYCLTDFTDRVTFPVPLGTYDSVMLGPHVRGSKLQPNEGVQQLEHGAMTPRDCCVDVTWLEVVPPVWVTCIHTDLVRDEDSCSKPMYFP
jgi:hypothetical protein